jgi:hypothetical protein
MYTVDILVIFARVLRMMRAVFMKPRLAWGTSFMPSASSQVTVRHARANHDNDIQISVFAQIGALDGTAGARA